MIRNHFFLTSGQVRLLIAIILISPFFVPGLSKVLVIFVCLVVLFLFRRSDPEFKETRRGEGEMLLSPVNGKIMSIKKIYQDGEIHFDQEIIIRTFLRDSWGVYLPFKGEMMTLKQQEGESIPLKDTEKNFSPEGMRTLNMTKLELSTEQEMSTSISLFPFWGERSPRIWMKSGDRGLGAACLGFMPWGGFCRLLMPGTAEILAISNEKVEAGQTVLAVLKRDTN